MKNVGVILAGGVGRRFGSNLPKQYHQINGRMLIEYVVEALSQAKLVEQILLVGDMENPCLASVAEQFHTHLVPGGETRNRSLQSALDYVHDRLDAENIIILDAVRPMIRPDIIDKYFTLLDEGYDCVITAKKITDSLGSVDSWQVDRDRYFLMQSPEAYPVGLLRRYFDKDSPWVEVLNQLPETTKAYYNYDFTDNLKLTYNWELKYLSDLLSSRP
jgi:2-C-methyl-D-erythritol 4-phosphate cytidylyltransferase